MTLKMKEKTQLTAPTLEPGTYPARVCRVIDLGVQPQRPYQGAERSPIQSIMMTYELVDEFMQDEDGEPDTTKPRWLSETFPFYEFGGPRSTCAKRLKALDIESDLGLTVGMPCNVTIAVNEGSGQHKGKMFENVANVSTMRAKDAIKITALVNEPLVFDMDTPDMEVFGKLHEWLREKIMSAQNFPGSALAYSLGVEALTDDPLDEKLDLDDEDRVPF